MVEWTLGGVHLAKVRQSVSNEACLLVASPILVHGYGEVHHKQTFLYEFVNVQKEN